jgi:hypothetical protein
MLGAIVLVCAANSVVDAACFGRWESSSPVSARQGAAMAANANANGRTATLRKELRPALIPDIVSL